MRHGRHRRHPPRTRHPTLHQAPHTRAPHSPARPGQAILDGTVLLALLGTCAAVYSTVGTAGFSAIIGAAAGLYGTWRTRR
ncbi:hypothetical protein [Streptomyces collinus]|uniref:hypothetical protein n=1 Tax=Streptomyces collinus TaxID=42684 RepID=UPI0014151DF8